MVQIHNFGNPKKYVKPEGTVVLYNGKKFVVESRPGPRKKKEPPIAKPEVLRNIIAIAEGTTYNEEQRLLFYFKDTTVGRGEKATRALLGIPLETPGSSNSIDIGEHEHSGTFGSTTISGGIEVKEWGRLRPGDFAGEEWRYFIQGLYADHRSEFETPIVFNNVHTTYRRQFARNVTKSFLETLPHEISTKVREELRPSNMLRDYKNMLFVWPDGCLIIPLSDYDAALTLNSVSQGLPRYDIKRKYLEQRALAVLEIYKKKQVIKMKSIGIIAGSMKPPHAGHFGMIDIASRDNDEVHLYVSLSDRIRPGEIPVKGETIERLWKEQYEKALPKNVRVFYTKSPSSPIRKVYEFLGKENEDGSDDTYRIYSMPCDLNDNFPPNSLEKYADHIYARRQIVLEPIYTSDTTVVSGTDMRRWLHTGDKEKFVENTPRGIDGNIVWETLIADGTALTPEKVSKKRKSVTIKTK